MTDFQAEKKINDENGESILTIRYDLLARLRLRQGNRVDKGLTSNGPIVFQRIIIIPVLH